MNFDTLVDRAVSLYDVSSTRASDVANERLQRMLGASKSLMKVATIGTTVAGQAAYPLDATIVTVKRVFVTYTSGVVTFEGTETLDSLTDLANGLATVYGCSNFYTVAYDTDSSQVTNNLYLSPAPTEAGASITANCAVLPAAITYGSTTALPLPLDFHEHLLAGVKAELSDEDERQDSGAKFEGVYQAGITLLTKRQQGLGQGSDRHRMRMVGYDV